MRKKWTDDEIEKLKILSKIKYSEVVYKEFYYRSVKSVHEKARSLGFSLKRTRRKITYKKIIRQKHLGECWECTSHCSDTNGYPVIYHSAKNTHISRYMYEEEYGIISKNKVIRHKCDNKMCINPKHLEIGTQKDNMQDAVRRNDLNKGTKNGMAKLDNNKVRDIKRLYSEGMKISSISKEFNMSYVPIWKIVTGRAWVHVI